MTDLALTSEFSGSDPLNLIHVGTKKKTTVQAHVKDHISTPCAVLVEVYGSRYVSWSSVSKVGPKCLEKTSSVEVSRKCNELKLHASV